MIREGRRPAVYATPPRPEPLDQAHQQGAEAAAVGFDWPDWTGVVAKVEEELGELRQAIDSGEAAAIRHEYGDVLMALATLGRHLGVHPAVALAEANQRFAARYAVVGALAAGRGQRLEDLEAAALDSLSQEAKLLLSTPAPDRS